MNIPNLLFIYIIITYLAYILLHFINLYEVVIKLVMDVRTYLKILVATCHTAFFTPKIISRQNNFKSFQNCMNISSTLVEHFCGIYSSLLLLKEDI